MLGPHFVFLLGGVTLSRSDLRSELSPLPRSATVNVFWAGVKVTLREACGARFARVVAVLLCIRRALLLFVSFLLFSECLLLLWFSLSCEALLVLAFLFSLLCPLAVLIFLLEDGKGSGSSFGVVLLLREVRGALETFTGPLVPKA